MQLRSGRFAPGGCLRYFRERDSGAGRVRRLKYKKSPGSESSRGFRGGGYLLFHFRSIIGVAGFNFSVRNGKRWSPRAMATLVFLFGVRGLVLCSACGAVWLEERVWKRNRDVNATNLACSVSAAAVQQVSVTASGLSAGSGGEPDSPGGLAPRKGFG